MLLGVLALGVGVEEWVEGAGRWTYGDVGGRGRERFGWSELHGWKLTRRQLKASLEAETKERRS
jgi:hypothetical protein